MKSVCFIVIATLTATNYLGTFLLYHKKISFSFFSYYELLAGIVGDKSYMNANLCKGKGISPHGNVSAKGDLDFSKLFEKQYKNPCFYRNVTFLNNKRLETPVVAFRCVPYFFIIGMPKCGTTDVWQGLSIHSEVAAKHSKEPMFINRKRFGMNWRSSTSLKDQWSFDQYLDHFNAASKHIQHPLSHGHGGFYRNLIMGEGTVDVSHENQGWREVPGNEHCNEPIILNSHFLHYINPKMKLIFMMRDPVDRIYSDYLFESRYLGYTPSVQDFHTEVLKSMYNHKNCRKFFTERGCAYNSSLETFKARLRVGMYHIYLEDWFRVFPRDQIFIIRFEDYIKDRLSFLKKIFKFLDMRPLTPKEEIRQQNRYISNPRTKQDKQIGDMMRETRKLLTDFYAPYNKHLAVLLQDERYLWSNSELKHV